MLYLGQATKRLTPFREIIGLDPSENMVKSALANHDFFPSTFQSSSSGGCVDGNGNGNGKNKFQFRRGNAEDLKSAGIGDESVDLVVAGASRLRFFTFGCLS
jgi:hypothetical protein